MNTGDDDRGPGIREPTASGSRTDWSVAKPPETSYRRETDIKDHNKRPVVVVVKTLLGSTWVEAMVFRGHYIEEVEDEADQWIRDRSG
jgi:hypothetical protein